MTWRFPHRLRLTAMAMGCVFAAALGLGGVFADAQWLVPSLVAVAAAFGIGAAARRLGAPSALMPLLYLVGLVLVVSIVSFPSTTLVGLPTRATARAFWAALGLAREDIQALASPVTTEPHLVLLAMMGLYVVAAFVDDLVFRARRPALAGLPLLGLYIVPASLAPHGVGVIPFSLAAFAYVGLLLTDNRERVTRWGKRLQGGPLGEEVIDVRPLTRIGWRLGTAAISLAIVTPLLLPDLGHGFLAVPGGIGEGDGPSSIQVISPIVSLEAQLHEPIERELIKVRMDVPVKLRLTTLDNFDGHDWTQSDLTGGRDQRVNEGQRVPDGPGFNAATSSLVHVEAEVGPLDQHWLPVPYAPTTLKINGDWRYDQNTLTIFSSRTTSLGKSYAVDSMVPTPSAGNLQLAPDPRTPQMAPYLAVPVQRSPYVVNLLAEITKGARTDYERVLAIQTYLRSPPFVYDATVSYGRSADDIETFLHEHRGFCEQFAATMAYLVRLADIPARVAVGFIAPTKLLPDLRYSVTNHDAHAWPEVFFANTGWVAFEPTPRSADLTPEPPYAIAPEGTDGTGPGPVQPSTTPGATRAPTERPIGKDPDSIDGPDRGNTPRQQLGAKGAMPLWQTVLMGVAFAVVLLVLLLPWSIRLLVRRRRRGRAGTDALRAHAAWCDLIEDAEDAGHPPRSSESPRQIAVRLAEEAKLPAPAAAALAELAGFEERARYAPTVQVDDRLRQRAHVVRHALLARLSKGRRLRIRLLPPATLSWLRFSVLRRGEDLLDRRVRARARHRLSRRGAPA